MRGLRIALAVFVGLTALARGDDSMAVLKAGGIVLTRGTPVRMAAEELYVSPDKVRVRFEFTNDTGKDIDTIVAFPLPDIDAQRFWGGAIGAVVKDPVNFVGFKASADGKPIAFKIEQRATVKGKDVTALLVSAGAVINPVPGDGYQKLDALPHAQRARLFAAGVADGDAKDLVPRWLVHTKFYWQQRFPAHKTVVIEHEYAPVTGGSFISFGAGREGYPIARKVKEYCIDKGSQKRLREMSLTAEKASKDGLADLDEDWTDYVLSTAKNWNGPIGRFRLTLDKLRPDAVVALCWDGAFKQSGPTRFEFSATNYVPPRDVHMVVFATNITNGRELRPR